LNREILVPLFFIFDRTQEEIRFIEISIAPYKVESNDMAETDIIMLVVIKKLGNKIYVTLWVFYVVKLFNNTQSETLSF
jgi:hypothetical protein